MEKFIVGSHIDACPYENTKLTIFNKNLNETFVLGEKESAVYKMLDGVKTISEIQQKCSYYTEEEIKQLLNAFSEIGLFDKRKKKLNPLKIKVRLFNPNKILKEDSIVTKSLHYIILLASPLMLILGLLMFRSSIGDVDTYIEMITTSFTRFNLLDFGLIFLCSLVCLALHELAHMITARKYGVNVTEIGVMLYFLIPCAYTNISCMNLLEIQYKKLIILLSGSIVNLGLVGLSLVISSVVTSPIFITQCLMIAMVNLGTIFMNSLIFLKFDRYYIMEVILSETNYKEKSTSYMMNYFKLMLSKDKTSYKELKKSLSNPGSLLQHLTYCCYRIITATYVPVILLSTIVILF